MASVVHFSGTVFATKTQEAFYGDGSFDTVSYANAPNIFKLGDYDAGVTVNLANPSGNLGWALGDTYVGVEKIVGSQYTDWLYGNSQANVLDGGGSPDFIYGRDGDDSILGSGGFDFLYGEGGNDVIDGQWHTDTIYGGDGDDKLWGGSNYLTHYYPGTNYADVLYGDAGNDELHGDVRLPGNNLPSEYYVPLDFMPGRDEVHGGAGNDTLNGDGGDDTLWGDSGADIFKTDAPYLVKDTVGADLLIRPGSDVVKDFKSGEGDRLDLSGQAYSASDTPQGMTITLLNSSSGVDGQVTLEGVHTFDPTWVIGPSTGNAPLLGGPADDILVGGSGNDVLYGFSGSDSLVGGLGDDTLVGGPGNDVMYGLDGKDILIGEAGIDGLVGGRGSDFLAGGSEADGFYFNDETIVAGEYDQVGDFQDGLDFVYLPTSAAGYTLTDTGLGALLSMNLGGSTWGVYFTGFTVSQLADQIIFA